MISEGASVFHFISVVCLSEEGGGGEGLEEVANHHPLPKSTLQILTWTYHKSTRLIFAIYNTKNQHQKNKYKTERRRREQIFGPSAKDFAKVYYLPN